jgi:hypothetical protein
MNLEVNLGNGEKAVFQRPSSWSMASFIKGGAAVRLEQDIFQEIGRLRTGNWGAS